MAKTNITQYSSTPSSNTDINNINIDENCPASGLNNAIRELMAHLKNVDTGSQALTALSVTGDLTVDTSTLKVDSTNNRVGIGTASPADKLHIVGSNGATTRTSFQTASQLVLENNSDTSIDISTGTTHSGYLNFHDTDAVQQGYIGYGHTNDLMVFGTNGSERMRIHNTGKLSINGTTAGSSHVTIYFESASYSALASQMTDNGSGAGFLVCRKSDGSTIGQVARNGTSDAVQFLTTSDYRLKENVSYDFDATTQLKQLRPCTFTWINDESNTTHQGFLAHEVQEIVPHAVNGIKDAVDENGNIEAQSIDKTDLVPLLVKTIQELEARITALENA